MSVPKRPSELLQQVMTVFKSLEKKVDKLQDDVNYQGQTLTDMRILLANMSGPIDHEIRKQPSRKATAVQHEIQSRGGELRKMKTKNTMRPIPSKMKTKSLPTPKVGLRSSEPNQKYLKASPSPIKAMKLSTRLSKADAPRKATTLRTQKNKMDKKQNKTII